MKNKRFIWSLLLIAALVAIYYYDPSLLPTQETPTSAPPAPAVLSGAVTPAPLGNPVKVADCKSNGVLPDSGCTPGKVDPKVTAQDINGTICIVGYSGEVRPPTSVTNKIKVAQLTAYGFTGPLSDYELDHLISLELGGDPDSVANLWPEPYHVTLNGREMGAREKDKVENYLHKAVCNGDITLAEAQYEIATDWTAVYYRVYGK